MKPVVVDVEMEAMVAELVASDEARVWVDESTGRRMFELTPKGEAAAKQIIDDLNKTEDGRAVVDAARKAAVGDA